MKIALISDIHANLEALEVVMAHIQTLDTAQTICLGDIVGYGASPNECTDIVRQKCNHVIAGNHDFAVVGKTDTEYFNQYAKQAVFWTRQTLTTDNFMYISELPFTLYEPTHIYVHATPSNPENWGYILSNYEAMREFNFFARKICFIGHSHLPMVIEYKDAKCVFNRVTDAHPEINLTPDKRYIINVGSVGQPRDGDSRACYAVYDTDKQALQFYRLTYDIASAQERILAAKLPKILAERLAHGK